MKNMPHGACFPCLALTEHKKRERAVASLPPPISANTPTYLPFPLPPAKHEKHTTWGVFLVFGMLHVRVFCVLWLACPSLQPPPSTGDARHAHVSPFPSPPGPPLPAKHKKWAHVACFSCLALLYLSPPAENEKSAQCGAFFVFSTCAAPLTPSASPLTPLASRLALNTENTPMWVCSLCSAHSISPPSRRTRTAHPCECAFSCLACPLPPPHVEHGEHTHVGVFSMFGAPCAPPPLRTGHRNTPIWVCSLVFSPYPHLPLPFSYYFVR